MKKIETVKEFEAEAMEVRTPRQIEDDKRREGICSDFTTQKKLRPNDKPYSICRALGLKYGVTTQAVAALLIRKGLLDKNKKTR